MIGKYSNASGLLLDFGGDALTIECGQAHVKAPYTVENKPTQFVINIQNSGGPFTLAVAPDNTLRGNGAATVNGHLVFGMSGDNVAYTPHSETCNVGTLSPKSAASSTSIASDSPATPPSAQPVPPVSGPAPAYASAPGSGSNPHTPPPGSPLAANTSPPSGTRAAMHVVIIAEFPLDANPMAGQSIFIMRERMDEVLRKLGVAVPPNSTPGKAMQTFSTSCHAMDCRPVMTGLGGYYVTTAKLDRTGKATLSAQAQTGPLLPLCPRPQPGRLVSPLGHSHHASRRRQHHHPYRCKRRSRPLASSAPLRETF
jgi:hypothetical protein